MGSTQEVAEEFWHTVNGSFLDEKIVRAARSEQLEWVEKADLITAVPRSEATSKKFTLKWVGTGKGDDTKANYRSRLVLGVIEARKSAEQQMEAKDLFSSMPPLDASRTVISLLMPRQDSNRGELLTLAF